MKGESRKRHFSKQCLSSSERIHSPSVMGAEQQPPLQEDGGVMEREAWGTSLRDWTEFCKHLEQVHLYTGEEECTTSTRDQKKTKLGPHAHKPLLKDVQ